MMTSTQTSMAVFGRMNAVVPHRGQRDKPEHDEVREQEGRHRRSAAQEFVEQRRRAPLQIGLRVQNEPGQAHEGLHGEPAHT